MVRVIALVEGQTERRFGQQVLAPHLGFRSVSFEPLLIGRAPYEGGVGPWDRARRAILALIQQQPGCAITTMFDLYGLPKTWPGCVEADDKRLEHLDRVTFIENRLGAAIRAAFDGRGRELRFVPYLSLHEYEALLFSDPDVLAGVTGGAGDADAFRSAVVDCGECERINDSPETAPSKRILKVAPRHAKVNDGVIAAERIGLAAIRGRCPHFAGWLTWLEQLGEGSSGR